MSLNGFSTRRTAYGTITNTILNLIDPNNSKAVTMPAEIRGFSIYNPNPDLLYLKIFNNFASALTLSSREPDEVYEIPAGPGTFVRPSSEARPYVVHSPTASYAITTQREAGATAAATACEGWVEFSCAAINQQGELS